MTVALTLRESLIEYRVPISAGLLVFSLASMFVLTSQSASSFATYLLAAYVIFGLRHWSALFEDWTFLGATLLLAYLASSTLWSEPWGARAALSQGIRSLLVFSFVVAVAEGFRVDWFRARMTRMFGLLGAIAALVAIVVFLIDRPPDGRLNGLGQLDTHVEAAMVFAVAFVCLLSAVREVAERRWLHYLAAAVLLAAVVLSGSRNAIVALGLGSLALYLSHRIDRPAPFVAIAAATLVGIAVVLALVLALAPDLTAALLPRGGSFRVEIWTALLDRIASADAWWFGMGALTPTEVVIDGFEMLHAHNVYLAVLYEGGLVGVALLGFVLVSTFNILARQYTRAEAKLAIAVLSIGLPGFFLDGASLVDKIGWVWLLFWLPVAIAVGLSNASALQDARRFSGRFQ